MSTTISLYEESLAGMIHGGTLNKIRNRYALYERVGNTVLSRFDPIETIRKQALSSFVHDDLQNYPLPSDFKKVIDIAPMENRQPSDRASRVAFEPFASMLGIRNKQITIEANEGVKFLRMNWKDQSATTLHTMDSLTANGTISVVGSATGLKANTQYKLSGSASIEFDLVASGDGIQNTTLTAVDLTDDDEYSDILIPVYLGSVTNLTSFTFIWGNDLTTNYWTSVVQTTQADGTAFRVGWNFLLFPWSTATETGTVTPTTVDSFKLTVSATSTISNIRVDNILFSLGRPFDLKYYSQYLFKNSAGTWLSKPTDDTDSCVLIGTALQIYILECLMAMAQQAEGKDSVFDITYAQNELKDLYRRYRAEHPSNSKKEVGSYWTTNNHRR